MSQEPRGHEPDERLLSIAEWADLSEDESGELVDGRLVEEEVPDKVSDYASFGIRCYWIVDPVERTVEMLELGADGRYVRARAAGDGRLEAIPGCDGLVLDLDALWAEIDRLGPPAADEGPQR